MTNTSAQITENERQVLESFCSYKTVSNYDMFFLMRMANIIARDRGWWDKPNRNKGEMIALMHSELSEMLEAEREEEAASDKIPMFTKVEEEAADVVIRLFDYCVAHGIRLVPAIEDKMIYNSGREYRHGKKF